MKDKKRRQNLHEAKTHFGLDLAKKTEDKYYVHRINNEIFNLGLEVGLNPEITSVPEKYKGNSSFEEGFSKGKRLLKVNIDLYNMGVKCYFEGTNIPKNYENNEYFMNGYNYACSLEAENEVLNHHSKR